MGVWREFLRFRVSIPLDIPLKRRMKLRKSENNWCWVNFKYEGIPTFCFICGMIGHAENFCERLFDTPPEEIEKPYGVWMRAEPRRRMHTMGAKWLKPGGIPPTVNTGEERGAGGGKSVIVIDVHNEQKGENSGITGEGLLQDRRIIIGGNKGNGIAKNVGFQMDLVGGKEDGNNNDNYTEKRELGLVD